MKYEVRYDPKALKQLEKLSKDIIHRIVKKMRYVAETGLELKQSTPKNTDTK